VPFKKNVPCEERNRREKTLNTRLAESGINTVATLAAKMQVYQKIFSLIKF